MAVPFSWHQVNIRPSEPNPSQINLATAFCKGATRAELVARTVATAGKATVQGNNNTVS